MNERKRTYRMRMFMSVSLVLVCSTLLVVNAVSRQDQSGSKVPPRVKNYVRAFKVESIEATAIGETDFWSMQLRNVSSKPISAYTYSVGPLAHPINRDEIDGLIVGVTIAPDATEEIMVSERVLAQSAQYTPPDYEPVVNIESVVFEDGSAEGNPAAASFIKDRRLGERIQLKRVCGLLRKASDAPESEFEEHVRALDSQIAALSDRPGQGQSQAVGIGLRSGKDSALTLIRNQYDITSPQTIESLRQNLDRIVKHSEEWLARYEKAPEVMSRAR